MPTGRIIEKYHQLDYPKEGAVILLLNEFEEILLIESLRYTLNKVDLELPAGGVEKDEDLLAGAKRELLEETGYNVEDLKKVYTFRPSQGMSNQIAHVFLGKVNKNDSSLKIDEDEVGSFKWFSQEELKKMVKDNQLLDSFTIIPLLLYWGEFI